VWLNTSVIYEESEDRLSDAMDWAGGYGMGTKPWLLMREFCKYVKSFVMYWKLGCGLGSCGYEPE
jgi:hypothetical protein